METISIKLEGLSRKDRKKAIKMIKGTGRKWVDEDRFKDALMDGYDGLRVGCDILCYAAHDSEIQLQLPQDFDKLKDFLGIKEVSESDNTESLTKQLSEAKKKNEALDNLLAFHRMKQDALLKRMRKDLFRDTEFKNMVEDDIRILNESYDKINSEFK